MKVNIHLTAAILLTLVLIIELLLALGTISRDYMSISSNYINLSINYTSLKLTYTKLTLDYSLISTNYTALKGNLMNLTKQYNILLSEYNLTMQLYNSTKVKYNECINTANILNAKIVNYTNMINTLYINLTYLDNRVKLLNNSLSICNNTLAILTGKYENKTSLLLNYIRSLNNNYTLLSMKYNALKANYSKLMIMFNNYNETLLMLNNTINYLASGGYIYEYGSTNLGSSCTMLVVNNGNGLGTIKVMINASVSVANRILSYGNPVMLIIDIPVTKGNPILAALGSVGLQNGAIVLATNVTISNYDNGGIELVNPINIIDSLTVTDTVILPSKPYYVGTVTITSYDSSKPFALNLLYSLQNQNAVSTLCIIKINTIG